MLRIAEEHLGPTDLHQVVVTSWTDVRSTVGKTVEYLDGNFGGGDVLNILRIAKAAADGIVPYRPVERGRIAIYSVHADT